MKFEYGPVETYVVELASDRLDPGVLDALLEVARTGVVRLLDLIVATRTADGTIVLVEDTGLADSGLELEAEGLLSEEDIDEEFESVQPGGSAAVAVFELVWATRLAERLAAANATVIRTDRIPAPIVNQVIAEALEAEV